MGKEEKITYIIRSGKFFKRKRTTMEWEEAKKLLQEAAEKSKDNTAYLDVAIDFSTGDDKSISFPMPYAVLGKQKKANRSPFQNSIYVDDPSKLKKPEIHKETNVTIEDAIKIAIGNKPRDKK